MGSRVIRIMDFLVPIFSFLRPSVPDFGPGMGQTDGRTDGQTTTINALGYAPTLWGGHNRCHYTAYGK